METGEDVKACCAALYEQDWVRLLLGESFHPGGLALTERLGVLLDLHPGMRVLDVAAGRGTSALYLAKRFGCEVVGTDLSAEMVREAAARAEAEGLSGLVEFRQGDAERLAFDAATFDVVLCECAFCTFPDKATAACEFTRVLRPGGRIGLSDLTRVDMLPPALETLMAWVACIADALPLAAYVSHLKTAGCDSVRAEPHDEALAEMVKDIRARLTTAQILVGLKKTELSGVNLPEPQEMARAAEQAVHEGKLGYALVVGERNGGVEAV